MTTTIRIMAVQKPALKMPSTSSQEVRVVDTIKAKSNIKESLFIVFVYLIKAKTEPFTKG
jgi:hypothetical protein